MRMLSKAGTRRGLAGGPSDRRRCNCGECDMTPDKQTQRTRENRETQHQAAQAIVERNAA